MDTPAHVVRLPVGTIPRSGNFLIMYGAHYQEGGVQGIFLEQNGKLCVLWSHFNTRRQSMWTSPESHASSLVRTCYQMGPQRVFVDWVENE